MRPLWSSEQVTHVCGLLMTARQCTSASLPPWWARCRSASRLNRSYDNIVLLGSGAHRAGPAAPLAAALSRHERCRGVGHSRICSLASISGSTARSRSSRRHATAVDPPSEGADTMQADPEADGDSDSDEELDISDFDLDMGCVYIITACSWCSVQHSHAFAGCLSCPDTCCNRCVH
jgi:hypothetical protein